MKAITYQDFMMGRDDAHPEALTDDIMRNASRTIEMANKVLEAAAADGVDLAGVHVASGWRPAVVNDRTANAAAHSKHISAQACDLADLPDRRLARWALANTAKLRAAGVLGAERPQWTPTWLHLQWVGVASGRFWFIPSSAPAIAAALPGELEAG